jgi:tetratricopeptide (TPR) repeat protein
MTLGQSKHKYKFFFLIIALFLYGNTLTNGYALDDEFVTGPENITAKGFKSIFKVFRTFHVNDESGNTYEYRPIVKVTYAIEHGLWGENIMLSHLVNVLFYALCLVVLFNLLKLIFKEINEFTIFFIVLIFAFLPVHSEVVASLKNRDVMLSFIFSMYSFHNIVLYFETKKIINMILALLMFALAFLSKFDVVPLLAIIPFIAYKKFNINIKGFLALAAVFAIGYLLYRITKGTFLDRKTEIPHRTFQYFENPLYFSHEIADKISAGFNSIGFYVKMLVWPNNMACYYGYNALPIFSFTSGYALLGLVSSGFLGFVFFTRFKKPDLLWYGVIFFTGFISMYLNVAVPAAGIVADRFMFFASIGFCIIAIYFFLKINKTKSKFTKIQDLNISQKGVAVIVIAIFSIMIIKRNTEWKSKSSLFESDVKKYPESVKLSLLTTSQLIIDLNNRQKADAMTNDEKLRKLRNAEDLLKKAIRTDSSCGGCYNNLSFMYLTFERNPAEALPYLKLVYKQDTTKKEVICNLGIAYFRLGDPITAEKFLLKSILYDKKKNFTVPYEVLQDLYSRTDIRKGINFFKNRLVDEPDSELYNVLLGKTYFEAKDTLNSINFYKEALKINPNNQSVSDFVTNLEVKYYKKRW